MTKPKQNYGCDLCGNEITNDKKYLFEVYDGSPWGKKQTKGANMDCCHKCFLNICSMKHFNGLKYEPSWETTIKNPKYTKENDEPYRLPMNPEITSTQPELATAV